MKALIASWKKDKLYTALVLCWLLTVCSSFFGAYLLPVSFPGIGVMYAFRLILPVTALLYVLYAVREKVFFWFDSTLLEKCVYAFVLILLAISALSLFRALDFRFTFRRLFNLCFDLCYFFLLLRLCRRREIRRLTLSLYFVMLLMITALGVLEAFITPIFVPNKPGVIYQTTPFFLRTLQSPEVFFGINELAAFLTYSLFLFSLFSLLRGAPSRQVLLALSAVIYFVLLVSQSRLCLLAFYLLAAAQVLAWYLQDGKKSLKSSAVLAVCLCCVLFANQYRYIVPPIRSYIEERTAYAEMQHTDPSAGSAAAPSLHIGDPARRTLGEQLYTTDEQTGEQVLRNDGSGGIRVRLLLHAWSCLIESHGLGVGLGNTETLAARRLDISVWEGNTQDSIHCFLARLAADYGVFALLPLCAIAFLLLKQVFFSLSAAIRRRDRRSIAYSLSLFAALLAFPIISTASSDAQDDLFMWFYLSMLVILSTEPSLISGEKVLEHESMDRY